MWSRYTTDPKLTYEAWAFGVAKDKLAHFVLTGPKRATASLYNALIANKEPMPVEGGFSVILDSKDNAICIIKTTKVTILPFREVTETMAWIEGEGDRSLRYWQEVHREFFNLDATAIGLKFQEEMQIVFEEFELVYPVV